ncbi:MAG TPA: tripartite tricarboxylate transporter substrate-binding protein [Ramlibacter sp.]|nr:tripartite tricarboxylate transporter substrate-binding protein [Ramlibacter sp.]
MPHFAGVLLGQAAGVPLTHIAYRGGAPAAQDLIGGQVPLMVDTASETLEHHKAGKVRILAVTGEQRSRALPDVPTLKELGVNIAADAFFGLYGPAGMPADVVSRIDRAVADALRAQDVQDKIYGYGLVPNHAPGPELGTTQVAHLKRWEAPIKASGFKAE